MLQVGVVGAGIAGLSAAIALSRAGHHVEVFEKSRFTYETGAAITIGPNGTRILSQWGFDFEKAGAVGCTRMTRIHADNLELDSRDSFAYKARYGNRYCFFHRADLHAELRSLTEALRPKVKTCLGEAIADIDVDEGIICLADGTELVKNLVIVADGAHSQSIAKFIGRPYPVHKSPLSLYRFIIPYDPVADTPEISHFYKEHGHGFTALYKAEIGKPGPLVSTCPVRFGTMMYCGVMHPSKPKERDLEGWISPATVEDVMSVVEGFHPAAQEICRKAKDVKVYTNMFRLPIETFTKGKAILVGDACHLVLPIHGQGACQALEDAMALEVLFSNLSQPAEVHRIVQTYNKLRLPRVSAIQILSNKMKPGLEEAMLDEARLFYDGPLPGPEAKTFSEQYNEFFFTYDIAREAKRVRDTSCREKNQVI